MYAHTVAISSSFSNCPECMSRKKLSLASNYACVWQVELNQVGWLGSLILVVKDETSQVR